MLTVSIMGKTEQVEDTVGSLRNFFVRGYINEGPKAEKHFNNDIKQATKDQM